MLWNNIYVWHAQDRVSWKRKSDKVVVLGLRFTLPHFIIVLCSWINMFNIKGLQIHKKPR